jgi:hypothetical protein
METKVSRSVTVGDVLQWVSARVRWYRGSRKLLRARPPDPPKTPVERAISSAYMPGMDAQFLDYMLRDTLARSYDHCDEHKRYYLRGYWCSHCRPDKVEELKAIPNSSLSDNVTIERWLDFRSPTPQYVWVDNGKPISKVELSEHLLFGRQYRYDQQTRFRDEVASISRRSFTDK